MNDSRAQILTKLKKAKKNFSHSIPYPKTGITFTQAPPVKESLDIAFVEKFKENGGLFHYCDNHEQFHQKLLTLADTKNWRNIHCWHPDLVEYLQVKDFRKCKVGHRLDLAHAGLTTCEGLIVSNGSILMSSALPAGRTLHAFPKVWLIIASIDQFFENWQEAQNHLQHTYEEQPSMIQTIKGPINGRLTAMKRHPIGITPNEIHLFLIDTIGLRF